MSYVIGLDLGTSGLKGLLVNKKGEIVTTVTSEYPLITPQRGYSEQDPEAWYIAARQTLGKIIKEVPDVTHQLEGISFSGQMHSLVLLDKMGDVIRNAILWNDVRTTKQCHRITNELGEKLINISKNKALEGFTLPKMLWVQEHEPENWAKVSTFLLPKDYLGYRLTGNMQMEYSDAAGTLLLDIEKKEWSPEILKTFQIDPEICPPLVESTAQIGFLRKELKEKFQIEQDVPIFAGGADNPSAAVGAGIVRPHQAMASIGTSGVFLTYEEDKEKDYEGHLHFFNHVIPNAHYSMGVTLAAGSSLNWFKDQFAKEESFNDLLKDIDQIPVGSEGLIFTPYISGERTPYTDSKIRGSFLGIDISHTRAHFARAVLEGITFSLRDSQELMKKYTGKKFSQIVSVGGGAKNKDWLQMQADIFNTPVITLETEQGPGMGAAMIAAVGAGWYPDFKACSDVFVNYTDEFLPIVENVEKYNQIYEVYRKVYPSVKEISHQLVNFE